MHSCNILHWSQFLRSIERILRDRNYYPLNVKHYSYTIEARRVGWGSQKESAVSGSDLYFTLKLSREVLWRHKLSRSEWCGLKIEQSGWHTECGPRLASYYKWLYVTHWEKCECEASQEQRQLLFNLIIPTSMQPLLLLTPQDLKASFSSDLDSPCVVFYLMLNVIRKKEWECCVSVTEGQDKCGSGKCHQFYNITKTQGRQNYTSPHLAWCIVYF